MRILITKNGENIFTDEEKQSIIDKKYRSTTINKMYKKKFTLVPIVNKNNKKLNKITYKNYFVPAGIAYKYDDFFSKTTSTFYPKIIKIKSVQNEDEEQKFRRVRINMKNVSFPKEIQAKYDEYKYRVTSNESEKDNEENLKIKNSSKLKLSLEEIINNKSAMKLKKEVKNRERMKEKLGVINELNFRTNYALIPKEKELDEILKYKKIKGDKVELIKYLNTHNNLSDLFLRNLVSSNKVMLEKFDKISQTLLFNNDLYSKLKLGLERKVKEIKNESKIKTTNNLQKMEKEVKLELDILKKYKKESNKKLNYIEKHKEIENEWKLKGIHYLTSKNYKLRNITINKDPILD